jgi:hypothetical protein
MRVQGTRGRLLYVRNNRVASLNTQALNFKVDGNIIYLSSIYIYKSESMRLVGWLAGWLAGWLDVFVCMLLGSGGLLLCSGGVFFGVRSGSITWQRHLYKIEPFLWGLFWGCCLATRSVLGPTPPPIH